MYESRATLNAKCSVVMNFFGLLADETDLIVLSGDYKKPEAPNVNKILEKTIT